MLKILQARLQQYMNLEIPDVQAGFKIGRASCRERVFKLPHNCTHLTASKVMLKILQARLQQYVNDKLPDVQEC